MPILHALVIGLVQGLAELFPVSGTGHAVIVPFLFGWHEPPPGVRLAMYAGTLLAIVLVLGKRLRPMLTLSNPDGRNFASLMVVGALPAAAVGLAFTAVLQRTLGRPVATAMLIGFTGYVLLSAERFADERDEKTREERLIAARAGLPASPATAALTADAPEPLRSTGEVDAKDAVAFGVAQATGFLPGLSHVGSSIAAGIRLGLNREAILGYAFLLTAPSLVIAIIAQATHLFSGGAGLQPLPMIAAAVASALGGMLAIRWFTKLFSKSGARVFGVYCILMMVTGLLTALARG